MKTTVPQSVGRFHYEYLAREFGNLAELNVGLADKQADGWRVHTITHAVTPYGTAFYTVLFERGAE
jgi:hypothetical protein